MLIVGGTDVTRLPSRISVIIGWNTDVAYILQASAQECTAKVRQQ